MIVRIKDILQCIENNAPQGLAESWDNVGLLVGERDKEVTKILVGLDPTTALVKEAIETGADTIITHHPIIFRPLLKIDTSCPTGKIIQQSLINNIAFIASHTNLDRAKRSVSSILSERLGLSKSQPLIPSFDDCTTGLGCIAEYSSPLASQEFCTRVLECLGLDAFQLAGCLPETIKKVAICGGSGSSFCEAAWKSGADIYISAEIKHDTARWVEEVGFCVVDAGHYATEQFAVSLLAEGLREQFCAAGWDIDIVESKSEKNPFVSIIR